MGNQAQEYKDAVAYTNENREIQFDSMPVSYDSGYSWGGLLISGFALIWGGIPTAILIGSILNGQFAPPLLFVLLFSIIGLGLFLFGLSIVFRREKFFLSPSEIRVERKRLTGSESWSEPLSSFAGIDSFERRVKTKNSSYTVYSLVLVHSDPSKNVCLYSSRNGTGHRTMQEGACRALGLPAISGRDQTGFVTRHVDDLDKSVRDLVREGKLRVDFNPAGPVPKGIELKTGEGMLTVSWDRKKTAGSWRFFVPLFSAIPVAMIIAGFIFGGMAIIISVLGLFFVVPVVAAIFLGLMVKEEMLIHPQKIITRIATARWGHFLEKSVDTSHIEEIRIVNARQTGHTRCLLLVTDGEQYRFGTGLSEEALEWLRQCILFVVSR